MTSSSESRVGERSAGAEHVTAEHVESVRVTAEREGTAVFVGRASFRMSGRGNRWSDTEMVPDGHDQAPAAPIDGSLLNETETAAAALSESGATFDQPVVLCAPTSIRDMNAAATVPVRVYARGDRYRAVQRAKPFLGIAAALVLGITVTLSAQAVMGRRVPAAVPQVTAQGTPSAVVAIAPPVAAVPPTVVLSTAVLSTVVGSDPEWDFGLRHTAAARHIHRLRTSRSAVSPNGANRSTKGTHIVWVDPFVAPSELAPQEKGTATPKARVTTTTLAAASSRTARRTWIDPFAN